MSSENHSQRESRRILGDEIAALIPDKSHYGPNYLTGGRMFSYAHQVETVLAFEPKRVLEVGPGPGIVTHALRSAGVEVLTLDVESTLEPDILGSVTDIPLEDGGVDVIVCCQVLEHLPLDRFVPAMRELLRVSRVGGVISLPDNSELTYLDIRMPLLHRRSLSTSFPSRGAKKRRSVAKLREIGHFWEISVHGVTLNDICGRATAAGWKVRRSWRNKELPWHRFIMLDNPRFDQAGRSI